MKFEKINLIESTLVEAGEPNENPSTQKVYARDIDFANLYKNASGNEEKIGVLTMFLNMVVEDNKMSINESLYKALIDHLSLLGASGLNQSTNPYIQFLIRLNLANKELMSKFNGTDYSVIVRLITDNVINQDTILQMPKDSILTTPNLYKHNYDEIKYYVQCYYYFIYNTTGAYGTNIEKKIKILQQDGVRLNTFERYLGEGENLKLTPDDFDNIPLVNIILLKYKNNSFGGTDSNVLRDVIKIKNAIAYLDRLTPEEKLSTDTEEIKAIKPSDKSKELFSKAGLDKLDKTTAKEVINQLLTKYKIVL